MERCEFSRGYENLADGSKNEGTKAKPGVMSETKTLNKSCS